MAKRSMKKEVRILKGYCLWARVQEDMPKGGKAHSEDTVCSLSLAVTVDTYKDLVKAGLKQKLKPASKMFGKKKDDEGNVLLDDMGEELYNDVPEDLKEKLKGKGFITIQKDVKKMTRTKGLIDFGLPDVYDRALQKTDELIGNGSEVAVKFFLTPYPAGDGWEGGVKLDLISLQVIDLVPFETKVLDTSDGFEQLEKPKVEDSAAGFEDHSESSDVDIDEVFK